MTCSSLSFVCALAVAAGWSVEDVEEVLPMIFDVRVGWTGRGGWWWWGGGEEEGGM